LAVQVVGDLAYVADGGGGVRVLGISDPASITEIAYYDTPGWSEDVELLGDLVYVADGEGGLVILRYQEPVKVYLPLIMRNY
jgi:hypothetical protein